MPSVPSADPRPDEQAQPARGARDGNRVAARFIRQAAWQGLPEEVRRNARMCLLDDLGTVGGVPMTLEREGATHL